ncbi:transposase [Streptomyces sp. NBC_01298]|uniref:RNA-guided endonuclease InsQ/TnpB family protein n=1 Tax=Streptomyces sp. NBC_01298 TaxID=2903817 RepID=UPI002E164ED9|nr:transposase [Streptomyces sp. NBC_01298]
MAEAAEQVKRVMGAEAKRLKREVLGIPDQRKHQQRAAKPITSRAKEPGTQQRAYRYRFYPIDAQAEQLLRTFGACRWVYNEGLALRVKAWEEHSVSLGSATYVRTGFRWHEDPERPGTGLIALAKQTEPLDVRWSRPLPAGITPVKLTVTRDRAGRFFLYALVEERIAPLPAALTPGADTPKAVGIDLGLAALVTLDDGSTVDHPKLLKKYEKKLARLQRELHRKQKGSANRGKARAKIARLYALISDVRKEGLDQLTTRLVRENQVLVVEDLAVA